MLATKEKIWKGEYVEMLKLLHREIQSKEASKEEEYELSKRLKVPVNIENLTAAFLIYASVYCKRFPERAVALLKYMDVIRNAYLNYGGYAWVQYDEEFRARMAADEEVKRGEIDADLWQHTMGPSKFGKTVFTASGLPITYGPFQEHPTQGGAGANAKGVSGGTASAKSGACWDYNKGLCTQAYCKFRHQCSCCGGRHALVHCASATQGVLGQDRVNFQEEAVQGVRITGDTKADRGLWEKARTPVKLNRLRLWLERYGDRQAAQVLFLGFSEGFSLAYEGPRIRRWADNLKYVKGKEDIVQQKLDKEVAEGRMEGPFSDWPLENLIVSPIGVVPKKRALPISAYSPFVLAGRIFC
ncbi:hypothetical protein NDU88_004443 [Pleurodeles waltl]|uniref:C3H1-type domain-containing protein n=1 Tax=Pleurodeles waltl TaxID=8319 RepID=A0AAV7WS00_PLEWA|nr:hypothetical protein NDU88_004443 [Pleurodeles waltl]